jgi:hypothetical protein
MAAWTNIPSPGVHTAGFLKDAAISAMALNAAISGSILGNPEACFVTRMAFPFGSTRGIAYRPRHQA